ncbi:hypothetical protein QBZ16_000664 [Prototheca wickerhamii]|uniref:Tyrosine specific protein phosphatases domain-containing protein n=1 Tax=Prototheca wickerhamii TaxID=3111 RepID=A0AAD9IP98_PROWI|nr:hypothetical protein QBZ16_000664 [Prototheca wickerhamii]
MIHLSTIVATGSLIPAALAISGRHALPRFITLTLAHIAGTGLLTPQGTIKPLNLSLLWPYHAALRTKLALQRAVSDEPAWNAVTPHYFIGAWPSEQALVPALNASVLDVTCELPLQVQPPAYLSIPVWDTHCPTPAQLDAAVLWAERQVAAGRTVLVHCAHGHGRSAAVLAAILIARGVAETPEEAEALMRAQRPRVKLNARQRRGVELWARSRDLKRTE